MDKQTMKMKLMHRYKVGEPNVNGLIMSEEVMQKALDEAFERYPDGIPITFPIDRPGTPALTFDTLVPPPEAVVGTIKSYDRSTGIFDCQLNTEPPCIFTDPELQSKVVSNSALAYRGVGSVTSDGVVTKIKLGSFGVVPDLDKINK